MAGPYSAKKGDTDETRVKRTVLGDETELAEREELERKQSRTITSEDHIDVLRSYILDLAKQAPRTPK